MLRWLVVGLAVGLLLSLAPSCGKEACGPTTCFGCCDATGLCVTGVEVAACGVNGAVCNACGAGQACEQGGCHFTSNGNDAGATDAGTDGGATAPTNPLGIAVAISPNPPHVGLNDMTVMVRGANAISVVGATVKATYLMPAMTGMGTWTATGVEAGGGEYTLSHLNFSMGGGWQVTVEATQGTLSGTQVMNYSP
jgi:hypothetical protein